MSDPTLSPIQNEQLAAMQKAPNFWQRFRAELDRRFNLGYWSYRRKREPREMMAYLLARKAFRPVARFSIIVPCFGIKLIYVIELVASLETQRYKNFELCICDDGDPDTTVWHYFENLKKQWGDRLRLTRHSVNKGICAATRSALNLATGDFVVFVDADDLLHKEALRLMAYRLAEAPDCDFLYSDHDYMTDYGWRIQPVRKPAWSPELLMNLNYIHHVTAARRELVQQFDDFFPDDLSGSQDFDFCLKMASRARRVSHLPFVLYHWRTRPGSVAVSMSAKPWAVEAFFRARDQYVERMGLGLRYDNRTGLVLENPSSVTTAQFLVTGDDGRAGEKISKLLRELKSSTVSIVHLMIDGMKPINGDLGALSAYALVPGVGAAFPFLRPGARTALTPTHRDRKFVLVTRPRSSFSVFTGNVLTAPIHGLTAKREALIEALEELNSDLTYIDETVSADALGAAIGLQFLKLSLRNVSVAGVYCERSLGAVQVPEELDADVDPYV